ncbi:hypothetical protein LNP74_33330 [Klebsiella pneumoniae subsp. pneumoniae]|nr:hypothetical protein [Klebsiella pneumoniae subsp. pneumoniae]
MKVVAIIATDAGGAGDHLLWLWPQASPATGLENLWSTAALPNGWQGVIASLGIT